MGGRGSHISPRFALAALANGGAARAVAIFLRLAVAALTNGGGACVAADSARSGAREPHREKCIPLNRTSAPPHRAHAHLSRPTTLLRGCLSIHVSSASVAPPACNVSVYLSNLQPRPAAISL